MLAGEVLDWEILGACWGGAQLEGIWYLVERCSVGKCLVLDWEVLGWQVLD